MDASKGYILLVGQPRETGSPVRSFLRQFKAASVMVSTVDQALTHVQQHAPYLVILSEPQTHCSPDLMHRLREITRPAGTTIIALTEPNDPRWSPQEDYPGLDGFLVKPLSPDVLSSVVASALAKTGLMPMLQLQPLVS